MDIMTVLEALDFLLFNGKMLESDFEQDLADCLMDALKKAKLHTTTQMLLICALEALDNNPKASDSYAREYERAVRSYSSNESIANNTIHPNCLSKVDQKLIQWCTEKGIFEKENPVQSAESYIRTKTTLHQ